MTSPSPIKVAALADIHVTESSANTLKDLFTDISRNADVLVLAGDLTNRGLPQEAHVLVDELRALSIPVLGVLGNHDFENGQADDVTRILCAGGLTMLGDEPCEVKGVGFAGTVGFCGGFDGNMLSPFGEDLIKRFVHETVEEALRLESALSRLSTERKVVVLHYSPIRDTVVGESPEIFPFLGCSRLCDPIDRFDVTLAVHGHAHQGAHAGKTPRGIPVFNVAHTIMRGLDAERPYLLYEV